MNEDNQIADLGTLYEPTRVAFTFDAPGWKWVLVLAIICLAYVLFLLIRNYMRNAYRRAALTLVQSIRVNFATNPDAKSISELMVVLKQVSISRYGRQAVSDLHGEEWLNFLNSKSNKIDFLPHAPLVSSALYKNELDESGNVEGLIVESENWIKYHA